MINETILQISNLILKNFPECSIWRAYRAYFERKVKNQQLQRIDEVDEISNTNLRENIEILNNSDEITSELSKSQTTTQTTTQTTQTNSSSNNQSQPKQKKTKRGKRGGKHQFYHKKKISNQKKNSKKNQNIITNQKKVASLTVGEKLISRPLQNGLLDRTITNNGCETQDIEGKLSKLKDDSHIDLNHLQNSATKKRKRSNNDNHENQLKEKLNSNKKLLPSNSGTDYHIQMRTMLTEVTIINLFYFIFLLSHFIFIAI